MDTKNAKKLSKSYSHSLEETVTALFGLMVGKYAK